jgi:hypothetical protein
MTYGAGGFEGRPRDIREGRARRCGVSGLRFQNAGETPFDFAESEPAPRKTSATSGAAVDFEGGPVEGLLVDGAGVEEGELGIAQS